MMSEAGPHMVMAQHASVVTPPNPSSCRPPAAAPAFLLTLPCPVLSVSLLPCPRRSESEEGAKQRGRENLHRALSRQRRSQRSFCLLPFRWPSASASAPSPRPRRRSVPGPRAGLSPRARPDKSPSAALLCSRVRPPINTQTHKQGKGQPESQGTAAPALPPRRIHPRPHPNRAARHAGIFLIFLSLADWSTPQILFSYNLLLRGSGGFHKPVAPSFLAGESAVPPFPHPSSSSSRPALPGSRFPRRFSIRRRWAESRQSAKVSASRRSSCFVSTFHLHLL